MSWFDERVGQQFIPAFKINQTALVINYLISGDFFGFVPKSFAFPYLQKGEIHELHHEFPFKFPEYNIYVIYLKNTKDRLITKLVLELLRI